MVNFIKYTIITSRKGLGVAGSGAKACKKTTLLPSRKKEPWQGSPKRILSFLQRCVPCTLDQKRNREVRCPTRYKEPSVLGLVTLQGLSAQQLGSGNADVSFPNAEG